MEPKSLALKSRVIVDLLLIGSACTEESAARLYSKERCAAVMVPPMSLGEAPGVRPLTRRPAPARTSDFASDSSSLATEPALPDQLAQLRNSSTMELEIFCHAVGWCP